MDIAVNEIQVKDYLVKSNLPASDYVINPYVGCPHACQYCYARFMKRFTKHTQDWGEFTDVKRCDKQISQKRLKNKTVMLSSVTDCYNPLEEKYEITRNILKQLIKIDCSVTISTKSGLIERDADLLEQMKDLKAAVSVNTLDEAFRADMDRAGTIAERLAALRALHKHGIHTVLFMSPIFPYLTDFKEIIRETSDYVCEYWFENLNLRGSYGRKILSYVYGKYPQYRDGWSRIYEKKDMGYWEELAGEMDDYCQSHGIQYTNYFYHRLLVEKKKTTQGAAGCGGEK